MKCKMCDANTAVVREEKVTLAHGKKNVEYVEIQTYCSSCGETYYTRDQSVYNMKKFSEVLR